MECCCVMYAVNEILIICLYVCVCRTLILCYFIRYVFIYVNSMHVNDSKNKNKNEISTRLYLPPPRCPFPHFFLYSKRKREESKYKTI